ncbi:hypothetical protein PoB_006887500 [Plakobranchus ocellatus]|uniref:Uncharacterized protein n=1 Tax=Plakobranchus ocellatus TaxID=259542 RepID=A0AAV4DE45_9GAST|nr:hypothetical protein PoB_006887500 [Plakobranchus ocellatus]
MIVTELSRDRNSPVWLSECKLSGEAARVHFLVSCALTTPPHWAVSGQSSEENGGLDWRCRREDKVAGYVGEGVVGKNIEKIKR